LEEEEEGEEEDCRGEGRKWDKPDSVIGSYHQIINNLEE